MPGPDQSQRLTLLRADGATKLADFAEEVALGLRARPKRLPSRFFYDAEGSQLFEEICTLPEYYVTRAERGILDAQAETLVDLFPEPPVLVELGSGSADKTRVLIRAFLARHGQLRFAPVDISRHALEESARALLADFPELEICGVEGEYERALERIHEESTRPQLILWLGSSIGNLHRDEAAAFLGHVRRAMAPADRLLVGIDHRKPSPVLEAAYDDARGVTARFNLNLLRRINRELGGHFDLTRFAHRAVYREKEGRVEMHLVSQAEQSVAIDELDWSVDFAEGESIHTENSYKYSEDEILALGLRARLRRERQWGDAQGHFSLNLFALD